MSRKTVCSQKKLIANEFIVSLVIFILAGAGFIGMHISGVNVIEKSETTEITASFIGFDYSSSRSGYIHYIDLEFSDAETMRIDSSLASWELINIIAEIPSGTRMYMLIDESRSFIMELKTDDKVLINFEDAQYNMKSDKIGLAVLGIITFVGGMFFLVYIVRKKRKGIRGQNEINDMINPV